MPTYVSRCHTCDTPYDYIRKVADRHQTPHCCGVPTAMGLTTPAIGAMSFCGHKGFHMPDGKQGRGTWIESGHDYKKYLRDNNKLPAHEAEAEAKIQKKNIAAADDKKRRDAVIRVITQQAP